jgi:hypothetical protein
MYVQSAYAMSPLYPIVLSDQIETEEFFAEMLRHLDENQAVAILVKNGNEVSNKDITVIDFIFDMRKSA